MRDFVIRSFDLLIWVLTGLMVLSATVFGFGLMMNISFFMGLAAIIGGILSAIIFAGSLFLLVGIYDNSKRSAAAMERLAAR